ncbi:hypothetical protein [Haploplasma axanthum]|uniref:Polysaccharide chain length determinant N-terminal domain-containing protein n=1 Tax=Haploplasma axanthum TaxID=29552 RepID=A0A449BC89_HAPAX|nr:hypothetical protein [Haploplasma axanthum]VEU79930.1 Uncharacterised protein [Haploplasma axanthum]
MENEQNTQELSLLDLWFKIWKNKILVILITIGITIIGVSFIYLQNKSGAKLENKFTYNFQNIGNEKYPDGSIFDYRELISRDFLTEIKESNTDFKDVDIKKLTNDNNMDLEIVEERSEKTDEILNRYYKITMSLAIFGNDSILAESFLESIHTKIINTAKEKNHSLEAYNYIKPNVSSQRSTSSILDDPEYTYTDLLNVIRKQYSLIDTEYTNLISRYGKIDINNNSIEKLQKEFRIWYEQTVLVDSLTNEVLNNGYIREVSFEETKRRAKFQYDSLNNAHIENAKNLNDLKDTYAELNTNGTSIGNNVILDEIASRTTTNNALEFQMAKYEQIMNATEPKVDKVFEENVINILDKLDNESSNFNELYITYLNENTRYIPYKTEEFNIAKPHSLMMMGAVIVILGGIIGVSAALIKEAVDNRKKLELE